MPADNKPVARALVQAILITTIEGLDLDRPAPAPKRLDAMDAARRQLKA